jgi:hypothetical protein
MQVKELMSHKKIILNKEYKTKTYKSGFSPPSRYVSLVLSYAVGFFTEEQ